jgi:hypothetical protein
LKIKKHAFFVGYQLLISYKITVPEKMKGK